MPLTFCLLSRSVLVTGVELQKGVFPMPLTFCLLSRSVLVTGVELQKGGS